MGKKTRHKPGIEGSKKGLSSRKIKLLWWKQDHLDVMIEPVNMRNTRKARREASDSLADVISECR